jgi:hypothetical protein
MASVHTSERRIALAAECSSVLSALFFVAILADQAITSGQYMSNANLNEIFSKDPGLSFIVTGLLGGIFALSAVEFEERRRYARRQEIQN